MSLLKLAKFVSFSGFPASSSDVVRVCVKIVAEKLKVIRSVIRSISVLVMDNKFHVGLDKMSDRLLHHKTMLRNVTHTIAKRMIWFKDINISGTFSSTATPKRSIFQTRMIHVPIIQAEG